MTNQFGDKFIFVLKGVFSYGGGVRSDYAEPLFFLIWMVYFMSEQTHFTFQKKNKNENVNAARDFFLK